MQPSKELITYALRMLPQYTERDECTGNIQYKSGSNIIHFEVNKNSMQSMNVYELMHLCKEWAYGKTLNCGTVIQISSSFCDGGSRGYAGIEDLSTDLEIYDFDGDTEPEAIFQACKWIINKIHPINLDDLEYNNFIGSGWVDWQEYVKDYNSRHQPGFIDNYPTERPHMFRNKTTKILLSEN